MANKEEFLEPKSNDSSSQDDKMIGMEIIGCKILEKIGESSLGSLYKANVTILNRFVAIKVLSPKMMTDEGISRFRREGQYMTQLEHPNIVQVNDLLIDEENRQYFITMQYSEGGTLEDVLLKKGALNIEYGVKLFMDVAYGLQKIHEFGIVHRNINPSSIILHETGVAKITDFGLATETEFSDTYLDIFALGITFYYAFTGVLPVNWKVLGGARENPMTPKMEDPQKYNTGIPPRLSQILLKMTETRVDYGYQSMEAVIVDLEREFSQSLNDKNAPIK